MAVPLPVSSTVGIVKVNRAPMPGPSLSAHIRPPCASTIPLQMARPRPDPATPLLRSSPSLRVNFLNRYGSRSEGMPLPSSATETAT